MYANDLGHLDLAVPGSEACSEKEALYLPALNGYFRKKDAYSNWQNTFAGFEKTLRASAAAFVFQATDTLGTAYLTIRFKTAWNGYLSATHPQAAVLIGPMLGGVLYYFGPVFDYGVCAALTLAAAVGGYLLPNPGRPEKRMELSWESVAVGFRFIWRSETILGAMLFEFMASLFGSVQALLPLYARDILGVGAWGAGLLRSATALGGLLAAAVLTRVPIKSAGGLWLFASFALLAVSTIAFGFSTSMVLSIVAMMGVGIGDLVSTVIRQTLIQMQTPDEMRGRVFSVNSLFYGTSAQIGQFRAGITAEWFGAVTAVAIGGAALLGAVALWAWLFPGLRRVENPALVGQVDPMGDQRVDGKRR